MEKISFENFIPYYPEINPEINIQNEINRMKEFNELKLSKKEKILTDGKSFYTHQKFFMRYLIAYDKIILIHEAGTGKTGSLIALSEYMNKNELINKTYVFEKGKATIGDFYSQLNKFNANKKEYEIMTYGEFANIIKNKYIYNDGKYNIQLIKKHFNNCIFFLDEAHNLKSEIENKNEKGKSRLNIIEIYDIFWNIFHMVEGCKIIVATATPLINDVNEITKIANLILPKDNQMDDKWDYSKVTLKQMEKYFKGNITYVRKMDTNINVIYEGDDLNNNESFELETPKKNWNYEKAKLNKNKQPMPEDKDLEIINIYTNTKVYKSYMEPGTIQRKMYMKYLKKTFIEDEDRYINKSFGTKNIQYSLFVYPNKTTSGKKKEDEKEDIELEEYSDDEGEKTIKSKMDKNNYYHKTDNGKYISSPELKKNIKLENLGNLSCKYKSIIEIELENIGNNCSFIYEPKVNGPGIIVLSLCLEENGFEQYNENENPFLQEKEIIYGEEFFKINPNFKKKPRYALITIETMNSKKFEPIKNLLNCPQNVYGEYLQIILGSFILRDGINLVNVTRCHLASAQWHYSGYYQTINRILRPNSQLYIYKELEKRGLSNLKIDVKMYNHVAVYYKYTYTETGKELSDDELIKLGNDKISEYLDTDFVTVEEISYDIKMYKNADIKNIINQRFMRILKQCAIDCELNKERNYLPDDIDYSKNCDYDLCKYDCVGTNSLPENYELDYKNYDILYSDEIIDECVLELKNQIIKNGYISFDYIEKKYIKSGFFKEIFVYLAIDKLITNKNKIFDRFGYETFINTDGTNFYLDKIKNINSMYSIYSNYLNGIDHTKLENIKSNISDVNIIYLNIIKSTNLVLIDDTGNFIETEDNFKNYNIIQFYLNKLSKTFLISFIEECLITLIKSRNRNSLEFIIYRIYENFIFHIEEPIEAIKKVEEYYAVKNTKQGRRAQENATLNIKNKKIFDIKFDNKSTFISEIYVHCLNIFKDEKIFKVMNLDTDIRIIKINDKTLKWRNTNKFETDVYKTIIHHKLFNRFDTIKAANNLIGIKINETFYLLNNENSKNTGQKCLSILISNLIVFIVNNLDTIKPYIKGSVDTNISLSEIKTYLNQQKYPSVDSISPDNLYFIYFLYKNYKRDDLCKLLETYLISENKTFILNF